MQAFEPAGASHIVRARNAAVDLKDDVAQDL
jgi:hypothetical protein